MEFLEPILDEAAPLTGAPREDLVIVRAERVVWPDAGLGCPEPGMAYPQVLVPGYWVVIEADGRMLDYRGARGSHRPCTLPEDQRQPPADGGV